MFKKNITLTNMMRSAAPARAQLFSSLLVFFNVQIAVIHSMNLGWKDSGKLVECNVHLPIFSSFLSVRFPPGEPTVLYETIT